MSILNSIGYNIGRLFGRKGKDMGNNQSKRIATAVTEFVNDHIGREFTAKELRFHIVGRVEKAAPASADRIMRQLRQEGKLNYVLVSRVQSTYKGLPLAPETTDVAISAFEEDLGTGVGTR